MKRRQTAAAVLLAGLMVFAAAVSAEETEGMTGSGSTSGTPAAESAAVRVGGLKGPTSMGIASLGVAMADKEEANTYEKVMVTAADELTAMVIGGEVDIALLPANVAGILYNRTEGGVKVIDINTLGVLYVVETGDSIASVEDLRGKTLYLTGKGTTPDYALQYLLRQHGLTTSDVTLEYRSEPTEVVSLLAENEDAVGLLPQPFVTVAQMQNENLKIALDLTKEWENAAGADGSSLVTGVTIVRTEFLEEQETAVQGFLADHEASTAYTNDNPAEAAHLIESLGIVEKAAVAEKAIPYCNITYIDGEEMKDSLGGYLQVLYDMDPASVGGALPDDGFYYIAGETQQEQ